MDLLKDKIKDLEDAIRLFMPSERVEVDIRCTINDDVPPGFVSVPYTLAPVGDYERYEKVLDAEGGMVTKKITLHIKQ